MYMYLCKLICIFVYLINFYFRILLAATDDNELYEQGIPLPLVQIVRLVRTYKMILYHAIRYDPSILIEPTSSSSDIFDHSEVYIYINTIYIYIH
jgi:hypothetical protein